MAKENQQINKKDIRELLNQQTDVILNAVDEKIINFEARIDKKIKKLDLKFSKKLDKLTTTLDNFLKRLTDVETEFDMMKADLDRVKKVLREKLGVEL